LREEQHVVSSSPASTDSHSQTTPAEPTANVEYERWQVSRLIVALVVCALIIGAVVAYDSLG
jgi:uncharacterized protein HemX